MGEGRVTFLLLPQVSWTPVVGAQNLFVPSPLFFFLNLFYYLYQAAGDRGVSSEVI